MTATTTATFRPGDKVTTGVNQYATYVGTIEDTHPERGILLVDRRLTLPRGAWFAPGELRLVRRVAEAQERVVAD